MHPVIANFMVADLVGTAVAFLLFPLFVLLPGYVCGWFLDALGFRKRMLLARFAISIPLSIGISPISAYLLWRWSLMAVWAGFGIVWIGFLGLLFFERRRWLSRTLPSKGRIGFLAVTAGWIALGTLSVIDLQFGNRLYFSFLAHDYTLRTAITASLTRSGIPPHNPYFFPGHPVVLRYHYFWFILCSLVSQIGAALVSPRQAMLAGTVWSGMGLIALIPLYLRFFQPKGAVNLERRMIIGLALLLVTGLDILPVALLDIVTRRIIPTIEMWNTPVAAWIGAVLWAPHHVAALIACLTGFLLIWYRRGLPGLGLNLATTVAAGTAFASALGLSVYVTVVFAAFVSVWIFVVAVTKQLRQAAMLSAAGFVSLLVSLPYFLESTGGHAAQAAGGGHLLQLAIRSFLFTEIPLLPLQSSYPWLIPALNTLLLPLNYLLEFGFFFLVALEQWRRMRAGNTFFRSRELCAVIMAATAILFCTFIRSGVITINDLGMRGIMVAQFVLLLWGAEFLSEGWLSKRPTATDGSDIVRPRDRRTLIIAMLVLGFAGTLYELLVLRSFAILADATDAPDAKWISPDRNLGRRTYALRQFYEALKEKLPRSAIIQHNPNTDPGDLPFGLYADRQLAAETLGCGTVFGGDPASCARIIRPIDDLFETPRIAEMVDIDKICTNLSINALIAKDTDRVWADGKSWIWKKQPLLANSYARAYRCGR